MKVLAIDPGSAKSGCLCAAVPPPPPEVPLDRYQPDRLDIYAEVMLYKADAEDMAEAIKHLTGGYLFETFIIDKKGSWPKPPGFRMRIYDQYAGAMERRGVRSRRSGNRFELGSSDVGNRELLLKDLMRPRGESAPILRIHNHLRNLNRQLQGERYTQNDYTKREKKGKKVSELVDCLEYIAGYFNGRLFYVPPEPCDVEEEIHPAAAFLKQFQKANGNPWKSPRPEVGPTFGAGGFDETPLYYQ